MAGFQESARCRAPAAEVWKLLHDPGRYTEWWTGLERVEAAPGGAVRYAAALPGTAIPTRIERGRARVVISCLLTDIVHEWTLEPAPVGCLVRVRVEVPEARSGWLGRQRHEVRSSLPRLVAAAERAARR